MASHGMSISGYDDLRVIGRGGFGVVYQGRDRRFARDVAVKVLSGVLDETMTARFERECHAVGALSGHPHIVVVHDSGTTDDGLVYLVMELLSGGSLAERLTDDGPQSWPQAAELGMQLAGALETAHRGGVLHRDVKPENVLFSAYRQPKLVDFGIATVRGGFETKSASVSASLAHAAPEILAGKRSSTASDVYALGSTLFQVLTGRPAFISPDDETLFPLLTRISSEPVPDLRPRGVPDGVADVIERAMAKAPEDRYESALAFAVALQQAAAVHGQVLSSPVVMGEGAHAPAPAPADSAAPGSVTTNRAAVAPGPSDRVPAQVVGAPPVESGRPRGRRSAALVAAAAVLLGIGAVAVLRGGDEPRPYAYRFPEARDGTVIASRTWTLDGDGVSLRSDMALTNPSSTPVNRIAIEAIPKSVATNVSRVTFTPGEVTVIDADPVVRWGADMTAGQVRHLRWTVRLPSHTTPAELRAMADDQRAVEQSLLPRLPAIAAEARVATTVLVPFPTGPLEPEPTALPTPTAKTLPTPTAKVTPTLRPGPTSSPTLGRTQGPSPTPRTSPAPPPPPPPLKAPGAPSSVLSGSVRVVARQGGDPNAQPTFVSVGVTWSAPSSGGTPASYCVRWTGYAGSSPYNAPSSPSCVTGRSARVTVPHVNPADSWLLWEVQARNKAGSSGWSKALAVVPDLVGGTETDGVDQLRAAGLRVGFHEQQTSDSSQYCRITDQSPRSGNRTGGSFVQLYYYVCP